MASPAPAGRGAPLEQLTEILVPNGALYDEDKLAFELGFPTSLVIEQRAQLKGEEHIVVKQGNVLLTPSGLRLVLEGLGLAKLTEHTLLAPADLYLDKILAAATFDPAVVEPEPRQAIVCGFPINTYLVQVRFPGEKFPAAKRHYARVVPAQRERLRHGKVISVYPPTKGNHWDTKKPRRK